MNTNLDPYRSSNPSLLGDEASKRLAAKEKEKQSNGSGVRLSSGRMGSMNSMNANKDMVKKIKGNTI